MSSIIIDNSVQLGTSNLNASILNNVITPPYLTSNVYFSNIQPYLLQSNLIAYYPLNSVMNASILSNSNNYQYYPLNSVMNASILANSNNYQFYLTNIASSNTFITSNVFNTKINATNNNFANFYL